MGIAWRKWQIASGEVCLECVLDPLRDVTCVTHRKMMGEYMLYSDGIPFTPRMQSRIGLSAHFRRW